MDKSPKPPPPGGNGSNFASHTVTFATNGGSATATQSIANTARAAKPADPVRDGYAFAGWFADAKLTAAYDFDAPVTANLTLYAKWVDESTSWTDLIFSFFICCACP